MRGGCSAFRHDGICDSFFSWRLRCFCIRCTWRYFSAEDIWPLLAGLTYPYDWGFVPSTKAEDGDPIDALIIHDAATYPGLVLKCKPIGVLEIVQVAKKNRERNDRIFLIPEQTDIESELTDVRTLSNRAKQDLKKFFEATDALENKKLEFLGWGGPAAATRLINRASR